MENFIWKGNRTFIFRRGARRELARLMYGSRVLVVTGAHWLVKTGQWNVIQGSLESEGYRVEHAAVAGEPSPEDVDNVVAAFRNFEPQTILAVGGGSVLDAGKAIAAMFCHPKKVEYYLEGVGTEVPTGATLPLIALPTTSGTGSEATKNAVISRPGAEGFKKSLRHDRFIPETAVIDPELLCFCPPEITICSAMDALTQLMESYLSTGGNSLSDMAVRHGLELFAEHFPGVLTQPDNITARGGVGLAAYLSGMALAHAGLGTVHGLAGVLGGLTRLPHGMIVSRLIPPVFRHITGKSAGRTLSRIHWIGDCFHRRWPEVTDPGAAGFLLLLDHLEKLLPGERCSVDEKILTLTAHTSNDKNSPVSTTPEERKSFLVKAFCSPVSSGFL